VSGRNHNAMILDNNTTKESIIIAFGDEIGIGIDGGLHSYVP